MIGFGDMRARVRVSRVCECAVELEGLGFRIAKFLAFKLYDRVYGQCTSACERALGFRECTGARYRILSTCQHVATEGAKNGALVRGIGVYVPTCGVTLWRQKGLSLRSFEGLKYMVGFGERASASYRVSRACERAVELEGLGLERVGIAKFLGFKLYDTVWRARERAVEL